MTDKEKIKFWAKGRLFEIMNGIGDNNAKNILTDLLSFINSLQENPVSEQNLSNFQRTTKNWKETVSENLEEVASRNYADNEEYGDDVYFAIKAAFKVGAKWQLRKTRYEKDENNKK